MPKLPQKEVLKYQKGRRNSKTVKRHYREWRSQQIPPLPNRCDEPNCDYFNKPLLWNGKELKLILDHISGVSGDNRPKNLRFLCPNCNSQQPTHGGRNIGKVEQSEGGFAIKRKDGKRDYTLPADSGEYTMTGGNSTLTKKK